VSQAELIETLVGSDSIYELRVMSGTSASARFPTPDLPGHCAFTGNPRGVLGGGWKGFEFSCDGGLTPDDEFELAWLRDGIMLTAKWADGSEARRLFKSEAGAIRVPLVELQVGSGSWSAAATRYTALGIEHILLGIDHLLFVLGLLLLVHGGWMLVKTITAFTLAHSITLGLATLGYVSAPTRPVEAAIALSIVFVAAEIVHARQGHIGLAARRPWVVAFAFGLLHGFGFAGALSEIGLPLGEIPIALLFFNVGVELGQIVFVGLALTLAWVLRRLPVSWPSWVGAAPSYAIGIMAMYWFIDRAAWLIPA
jgi:hypothetical protein